MPKSVSQYQQELLPIQYEKIVVFIHPLWFALPFSYSCHLYGLTHGKMH